MAFEVFWRQIAWTRLPASAKMSLSAEALAADAIGTGVEKPDVAAFATRRPSPEMSGALERKRPAEPARAGMANPPPNAPTSDQFASTLASGPVSVRSNAWPLLSP